MPVRRTKLSDGPIHRRRLTPDSTVVPCLLGIGDRQIDRLLVHIHAHIRGARLFHGLPPRMVVDALVLNMWLCALTRVTHDTLEAGRLFALSHSV
jgi:hypothetical protein